MSSTMPRAVQVCLPQFIAVGPQRSGTTWLHEVLREHASLPSIKETDFFSRHYSNGIDWYLKFFADAAPGRPRGEINPNYFGITDACERIATLIPHCRIIVTLRDPTERAWSSYRVMRRDAWTRVGFEETVARNPVIRESSRYAFHLANWFERFGRERVLVLFYEELEANPQAFLDRICEFIGIASIAVNGTPAANERINTVTRAPRSRRLSQNARNARDWMRLHRFHRTLRALEAFGVFRLVFGGGEEFGAMDRDAELRLRQHFRPEVEAVERLLGRDLSAWKRPRSGAAPGARDAAA
jgi:LPS sulfotransferase NodH